jgi:hypothetical protein
MRRRTSSSNLTLGSTASEHSYAVELARYISDASNLGFCGIIAFESHIKRMRAEYDIQYHKAMEEVVTIVEDIEEAGTRSRK